MSISSGSRLWSRRRANVHSNATHDGDVMTASRFFIVVYATIAMLFSLASFSAGAQGESLRLGFLTVRSGALAAGGKQMEEGITLFLKQRNYMLAGRKVELFIADTGGQPALAKSKTQELVERDKVHV